MPSFLEQQLALEKSRTGYAVVTIVSSGGSTPREYGKMLVTAEGYAGGTIGGGNAEYLAIADAQEALKRGRNTVKTYTLQGEKSSTGMTCGGELKLLFEVYPARPVLVMIGAGHVGKAVLTLARFLGFDTVLLDDRPEADIRDAIALADRFVSTPDFTNELVALDVPADASYVIATHGHKFDSTALKSVLGKPFAYAGMIGSRGKVNKVIHDLRAEGVPEEKLAAARAPIGLELGGETPEAVAFSILAEIMQVTNGTSARPMREVR
ncbi:MAG: XdhC/CoxI family protein [Clostridia bacterium]|nr:XdhC/CoxI family protein [Clostridia bacterium]